MYSRRTGVLRNESEVQKKINNFNNELREQYRSRGISNTDTPKPSAAKEPTKSQSGTVLDLLKNENVIIIGLMLLLLSQENKDYLLIGALAALLFLTQ